MPNRTTNFQPLPSDDIVQRAIDTVCAPTEESESSKTPKQTSEQSEVRRRSYEFASAFWKTLVNKVGASEAKAMLHHIMGDKKSGRPRTDQDTALIIFIYSYILRFGLKINDKEIARHILKSGPHYLYYESGAVVVANSEITEAYLSFADDPVVERKPIDISVTAITKRVERVRRWSIKEDLLSREYAPRSYRRD
jgi:hypothetical protein